MESARRFLVQQLKDLMKAKDWSVLDLHNQTDVSRSWITDLVSGERDFGIDAFEQLLLKGFGKNFDFILSAPELGEIPVEGRDLYRKLQVAIENAIETGTLDAVRYAMTAITNQTIADKVLHDKTRPEGSKRKSKDVEKVRAQAGAPDSGKRHATKQEKQASSKN